MRYASRPGSSPGPCSLSLGIALFDLPAAAADHFNGRDADRRVGCTSKPGTTPKRSSRLRPSITSGRPATGWSWLRVCWPCSQRYRRNLFAASRVGMSMARDRTLPAGLARVSRRSQTPKTAVGVTGAIVLVIVLVIPDVAAAGAAASLIFLITFALAHWITILVRQRSALRPPPFRTPWFPAVPLLGGLACLALAIYQGIAVPAAGLIAVGVDRHRGLTVPGSVRPPGACRRCGQLGAGPRGGDAAWPQPAGPRAHCQAGQRRRTGPPSPMH